MLPEALVPAAIGVVAVLPLTSNGKVDAAALPPLVAAPERSTAPEGFVIEAEWHLADVWEAVLGVRPESRDDNFFDLGGHSLLAVRMVAAVRRTFGYAPPLSAVFEAPTVRALARRILGDGLAPAGVHVFPMSGDTGDTEAGDPVLFVHGAEANCVAFVALARRLGADRPVYGTQGQGLDGGPVEHRSVEDIAAAYVAEWVRIGPRRPVHLVGLCYGAVLALAVARRMEAVGGEVGSVVWLNQSSLPVERRRSPLARAGQALRQRVRRAVRAGLWAVAERARTRGHSLGRLGRIPYVDRALAFEARRDPATRQGFVERHYEAIVRADRADRAGAHGYTPDDVREAVELYQRRTVSAAYRRMIEAYPGGAFAGRVVMLRSDAHAADPVSPALERLLGRIERRRTAGPHVPLYEPFVDDLVVALGDIVRAPELS